VRYDGVRFAVFDKSNSKGLVSNRFSALRKFHRGRCRPTIVLPIFELVRATGSGQAPEWDSQVELMPGLKPVQP
jgi:hypothetical protein